ncbi:TPA: DNA methylase [Enterococcus faecium]|uniref:DNA methyltransferase n=1 Tax=Enterococcus faecium TaxID=1352 RepID=UPI0003307EEB|nr:DNA methyltransferase [Enterococcus faecium]EMF0319049.1 DNA methylase [Enterococcus faecium]EOF50882.1 hypothetical protein SCW_02583 [Enterococcus faecium EnGen0131]ERT32200.1 hypothetical protein O992_02109 [Enterococcus faecium NEF1]HAZ1059554.1 DNA methylase [Enterococcus faecium]HAZ1068166.1 DNA methylase [Enterococcus faecium]
MSLENKQLSFGSEQRENKRVTVLGMEFENDDARREYFREELRKKLPELRKIEGFPIGNDEDIIELSDPPFYTVCPNPFINRFINEWKTEDVEEYSKEPLAVDISFGKNTPIYNAHTYHTKVPYKAIMSYLLHYTKPGDIVYDAFSGTGMTGVASSLMNNKEELLEIKPDITDNDIGVRHAFLSDLAPVGSVISEVYNSSVDSELLVSELTKLLADSKKDLGWVYKTEVNNVEYDINYTVWSDVFSCPNCLTEFIYYEEAFDIEENKLHSDFSCPNCGMLLNKQKSDKVMSEYFDAVVGKKLKVLKQKPVLISYGFGRNKGIKKIGNKDKELLEKIDKYNINKWFPAFKLPKGDEIERVKRNGIEYTHQFYTKRNLIVASDLLDRISKLPESLKRPAYLCFQSIVYSLISKLVRYNMGNRGNGMLSGTYYLPSLMAETNVYNVFKGKVKDIAKALIVEQRSSIVFVSSAITNELQENSVDYIFTDPPFGENIDYSELNFLWESWLKVFTNSSSEAIINDSQNKGLFEYKQLMEESFRNYFKVLKPNHWITVEFSNSKSSVWNAIQDSIQKAGFIIADVSALDKKQGSFKAVTTTTAVKQDLVISAYKPTEENIDKMKAQRNNVESAWTFVTQHLSNLPVFMGDKGDAVIISERTPRILFDRMVAYHVQQGLPVPISSAGFQSGIASRYPMRDGMAFLDSQVAEYDKKRILAKEFAQLSLFVSDENSAIEWIRQQLMKKPQSRQDIHPQFMKEIQHIAKYEELPELDELLAQNFLCYDGDEAVPNQISTYLTKNYHDLRGLERDDVLLREKAKNRWYVPNPNQQADLEKLREKSLLREFGHYLDEINNSKKKLKVFRTEAIRVGFKKAWTEKEYQTIVTVGERLPEKVIQEDDKLLMYYDNALMRTEM